jgi:uncharacterized protein
LKKHAFGALLLCVFLLISLAGCGGRSGDYSSHIPDPTDAFYVLDTAGVMSSETRNYIVSRNDALFAMTGAQVVVACIPSTEGMDIGDYTTQLFNKWGIGSAEKNNGVLILLSISDDNYWILQGKGLEDLLSSGTLKQMVNADLEPHFAKKEYDAGARAMFDSVCAHLASVYNVDLTAWSGAPGPYTQGGTDVNESSGNTLDIFIWAILIVIIILFIAAYFNSSSGGSNHHGGSGGHRRPRTRTYVGPMYGGHYHRPRPMPPSYGHRPGGFSGGGFSGGSRGGFSGDRSGGGGISRGGGVGRR